MSKKNALSNGAAQAVATAGLMTTGVRMVRASILKAESEGYLWGDHARDRFGNLYKLQAEKTIAITTSYAQNGVREFTLTAILQADGTAKLTEGRHRVFALPDDAMVRVDVVEGTNLDALTMASRSNGEGMGFTITAATEQVFAFVMELCRLLASVQNNRTGNLADLPLPKPKAAKAYTADRDGNPFASHTKRGDFWTGLDFTAEGLAKTLGLSAATTTRVLEILSGLWNAEEDPSSIAGMTTASAQFYAKTSSSLARKLGDTKASPDQLAAKKRLRDGLKKGHTLKSGSVEITEAPKAADAIINGTISTEKPVEKEKDDKPRVKRTPAQRIVDLLKTSAEICAEQVEDEKSAEPVSEDRFYIRKYINAIEDYLMAFEIRAEKADAPTVEDVETLDADALARLEELRQIAS